jgi:hypothetical protein
MRSLRASFVIAFCVLLLFVGLAETANAQTVNRYIVMRVDFQDSGTTQPRYSRQQVEQLLANVTSLFAQNSNNTMRVEFVVTDIFRLPKNQAAYGTAASMETTLVDALASAPAAVRALWSNDVHAIVVVLSQRWDLGGSYYATRNVGAGGSALWVGNAVVGENPGDTDRQVWGRWAHEVGHNLQAGAAKADTPLQVSIGGHPSGYQSDFDLMDANYPGRIGAVSIQPDNQFRNVLSLNPTRTQPWLSSGKYQTFTRALGGGNAAIWAIEYDQNAQPNVQAVKVEIAPYVYYMVSVRRRVRGDDLNDTRTPQGIPDEGVLIERVDEVTNPQAISKVIGRNMGPTCAAPCNRRELWKAGDVYRAPNEVTIEVTRKVDDDNYLVRVIYNDVGAQPDVMINPWLSPPGNTWETTDIWVDSPVNGFGVFRYGTWDDGRGQMVPVGNGDDPAVGMTNRVYARIRNIGNAIASNVVATFEVTDPLGMGITGRWALIGNADAATFPQLASIPAGGTVDVYVDWKPTVNLTPAQLAAGVFYFHSCLRLRMNAVPGETVLANQDGDREQENISYFQVPPRGPKRYHKQSISIRNDDLTRKKNLILGYRLTVPRNGSNNWRVQLNNGVTDVTLAPGELREIPVEIIPGPTANQPGQRYSLDVYGLSHHLLVNDLDNKDLHNEFRYTGGARIEALVVVPTRLKCSASITSKGLISVIGQVDFPGQVEKPNRRLPIMAVGWNSKSGFIESSRVLMIPERNGQFRGSIRGNRMDAIERVDCMFSGTTEVSSAWQRVPVVRKK